MRLISSTNLYTSGTGRQDRGEHGQFRKYSACLYPHHYMSIYITLHLSPYGTAMEILLLIPVASGKCTHIHVHTHMYMYMCTYIQQYTSYIIILSLQVMDSMCLTYTLLWSLAPEPTLPCHLTVDMSMSLTLCPLLLLRCAMFHPPAVLLGRGQWVVIQLCRA